MDPSIRRFRVFIASPGDVARFRWLTRGARRQGRLRHQTKKRQADRKAEIAEIEQKEEKVAQASVPASLQVWRQQ